MNRKRQLQLQSLSVVIWSCARSEIKNANEALRLVDEPPELQASTLDDPFFRDLTAHVEFWQQRKTPSGQFLNFGPHRIPTQSYVDALVQLKNFLEVSPSPQERLRYLNSNFVFMEIYGREKWGEVFMTSYFSPVMEARLQPDKRFSQALYARPQDLVEVDMKAFAQQSTLAQFQIPEFRAQMPDFLRGRLVKDPAGVGIPKLLPFYSRAEIESGKLKDQKLELFYIEPIEAFILHIQGSGTLEVPGQEPIHVVYDGQNGHRYEAVGKFLRDKIPKEQMNLFSIERELKKLKSAELQVLLNKNPSYVFFKKSDVPAATSFGITAQPARTIATDPRYFPKGAMALLKFSAPRFENAPSLEPKVFEKTERLVFDHDTGGAIKGPDRLDYYWGYGFEARRAAGYIKDTGELYYLFPRSAL